MKWLNNLIETFNKGKDYDFLLKEHKDLQKINKDNTKRYEQEISDLLKANKILTEDLYNCEDSESKLKEYWYNKFIKKVKYSYGGKDLKKYCTTQNSNVPLVTGKDIDTIANKALLKVYSMVRYTSDVKEHWQFADETVERGLGDCEDGAILMYNIMVASGVPAWRVRLNAGDVQGGGHAYVTYLREKDSTWYVMDWCYWFNESRFYRKSWKEAEKYFGIWFSWNEDYTFFKPDYKQPKAL